MTIWLISRIPFFCWKFPSFVFFHIFIMIIVKFISFNLYTWIIFEAAAFGCFLFMNHNFLLIHISRFKFFSIWNDFKFIQIIRVWVLNLELSILPTLCPTTGEGNGTPLQYSCLENPMDGGAWCTAIYGVAQSRTRLKRLSSSSSMP